MARVPGRRGPPTLRTRGRSSAVLLAALLSSHCAAMGAAPAETELTAGVAVNGTTAKNEAAFFHFTLAPYEDAVLTLTMLDGDADVYVLGPSYSRLSGFGPGPKGATAVNVDHFGNDDNFNRYDSFWSSYESAGTDEVLYISSSDDPIRVGSVDTSRTFRVGVWGWSRWGEHGARGSAWSVSFEPRNHAAAVNRADQKAAMRAAFDACCGDGSVLTTHTTQCKDWRDRDDTTVPMDACHVRGNVCDASGALSSVGFAEFNMTCDLGALVVALAPVLGSVTRFDVSANPSLTTGRADVSAWPAAARTPAGTLAALLRATAPNVTHLHLEANVFLFDGSASDAARRSENTFTPEVCSAFRDRASTLASFKARRVGLKGAFPIGQECLLGSASVDVKISGNALSGALPAPPNDGGCPALLFFRAEGNAFEGTIPERFATNAPLATFLDFSNNRLTGNVPGFGATGTQDALQFLRAKNNSLVGGVPGSLLGADARLVGLDLSRNLLSGPLPRDAFAGPRLTDLDLRRNALTGRLPDVMSLAEAANANSIERDADGVSVSAAAADRVLAFVDLAENAFEGYGFPDALVAAPQLTYLYLENNALTGDLPSLTNGDPAALEHNVRFKRTRVLSLSKNRFTGFVPDDHLLLDVFVAPPGAVVDEISGTYVTLQHVYDISDNQVGGSIPTWFAMYREYEYITVALENNLFACPVPDAARYLYRETACVRETGEDDYVGGSASGRKEPPDEDGNVEAGTSIGAGIEDERAYSPSSAQSAAEPRRSEGVFGFGSLGTVAGAGALFAALLALSLLTRAAGAHIVRQRRRALARDAFDTWGVDRLDDIGRRNAWGDVEMADRRGGGSRR